MLEARPEKVQSDRAGLPLFPIEARRLSFSALGRIFGRAARGPITALTLAGGALLSEARCGGCREAGRRGCNHYRQSGVARIRLRNHIQQSALRRNSQPLGCRENSRRLERWLGGRGGAGARVTTPMICTSFFQFNVARFLATS
mgnify:CR=1 FL=1